MAALNLGAAGAAPAVAAPDLAIQWWGWSLALVPFAAAAALAWAAGRAPRSILGLTRWDRRLTSTPAVSSPASWSFPARLLVWAYLGATALTHLFAAGAIWQATQVAVQGNAAYFRYATLLHLCRMSHQHAFGHGTMYLILGAIALATRASARQKTLGIGLTFAGAVADLASWWLQKFGGPSFEPLSIGGGLAFSSGFVWLAALIVRDLLHPAPRA